MDALFFAVAMGYGDSPGKQFEAYIPQLLPRVSLEEVAKVAFKMNHQIDKQRKTFSNEIGGAI